MFAWAKKLLGLGKPARRQRERAPQGRDEVNFWRLKAKHDAAITNHDNKRHWLNADSLSANAANSLEVRSTIRNRARYETGSNSYAKGITLTLANNLIGPGPRLQWLTDDDALNAGSQSVFEDWAAAVRLADSLRTLKQAKTTDGESIAVMRTNRSLAHPVKLDLELVECDRLTSVSGFGFSMDPREIDGIHYDDDANPVRYDILRQHPGEGLFRFGPTEYTSHRADMVCHWFRADRPGQCRGVSEISPALPLFAWLRRFTLATLSSAELAALFSVLLETALDPNNGEDPAAQEVAAYWSKQELTRGMMTALPEGMRARQLDASHPNSHMEMFVKLILREIARCLNVPFHLAAGDYSDANYSTARLGSQDFRLACNVERQDCEREVLEPILANWWAEALLIPGLLPEAARRYATPPKHAWHFPGWAYIDPQTEAQADTERLNNGTATLASACAARGDDWKATILQAEREKAYRLVAAKQAQAEYGIKPEPAQVPASDEQPTDDEPADDFSRARFSLPVLSNGNGTSNGAAGH